MTDKPAIYKHADKDGHFRRADSNFRSTISRAPDAEFPAEANRYILYVNLVCPWAHRTNITRHLKGLEDIIQRVIVGNDLGPKGWYFTGLDGSAEQDPKYGFKYVSEFYYKANPDYQGRFTVPFLWDTKKETIVNNESSEIIRMLFTEFDDLVAPQFREENHPGGGYYPEHLRSQIDEMNEWVYHKINNGVYKTGFATTQKAYDENVYPLFEALDRVEQHMSQQGHQPYLFGEYITEADIRLYTTLVRFDAAYHHVFKCNIKMIRHDYPHIHRWLRLLYWDESDKTKGGAFKKTSALKLYKINYLQALGKKHGENAESMIVPAGPIPEILPLDA